MSKTSEGPSSAPGVTNQASPPDGITKLNDSLWRFNCRKDESKSPVHIVFFHGLQLGNFEDAFWKTWLARGQRDVVWPKEWLPKRISNADLFSVSYDASAKSEAALDMRLLGENLVGDIILDTEYQIGQNCPVFLVGHSVGGLLIKQFVISASDMMSRCDEATEKFRRISKFLRNLRGVFYYGTPHAGSEIAELTELISSNNPILQLLKTLNKDTARINEDFRQLRANKLKALQTYAVAENLLTSFDGKFNRVVVGEASARQDVDYHFTSTNADHVTVCQAQDELDGIIRKLTQFINEKMGGTDCQHGQASASESEPPLLVTSHTAEDVRDARIRRYKG